MGQQRRIKVGDRVIIRYKNGDDETHAEGIVAVAGEEIIQVDVDKVFKKILFGVDHTKDFKDMKKYGNYIRYAAFREWCTIIGLTKEDNKDWISLWDKSANEI